MKNTWLVQRLQKPYPGCENNPFNFGGGLARGGINKDAYAELNKIFRFDYMGAAEFEFGAVPKSLQKIVDAFREVWAVWGTMKVKGQPVYYICHAMIEDEVKERIKQLANPGKHKMFLKEYPRFDDALEARNRLNKPEDPDEPEWLRRSNKHCLEYIGWLELDNSFIFFLDKEAFDKLYSALRIDSP